MVQYEAERRVRVLALTVEVAWPLMRAARAVGIPYPHGGRVLGETPVEHEPWQLTDAASDVPDETLTIEVGLPAPAEEPLAHWLGGAASGRRCPVPVPLVAAPPRRGARPPPAAPW